MLSNEAGKLDGIYSWMQALGLYSVGDRKQVKGTVGSLYGKKP